MATIISKKNPKGKTYYTAQARVTENKVTVYSKARNYTTKQDAKDWGVRKEAWARANRPWDLTPTNGVLYRDATERYIVDMEKSPRSFGDNTKSSLRRIARHLIFANLAIDRLDSSHVMNFLLERSGEVQPATVAGDLSAIKGLVFHARVMWSMDLKTGYFQEVSLKAKNLNIIGKSKERDVRPTLEELAEIMSFYDRPKKRERGYSAKHPIPMHVLIPFQIFSTRRSAETTRILWTDLDVENKRVLVRDMKDPRGAKGNHRWCSLPDQALAIILAQPRKDERIFPYNHRSVEHSWAKARDWARMEHINYHDLRHEGTSRLFEIGLPIHHVQMVTQHGNWKILERYTHLESLETFDKYEGWEPLKKATASYVSLVA
jgi:integrase